MRPDKRLILACTAKHLNALAAPGKDVGGCLIFSKPGDPDPLEILQENELQFGPRDQLEQRSEYRQIVPYIVFRRIRSGTTVEFLTFSRTTAGGEDRLHGKVSIGFGGHVDLGDVVRETEAVPNPTNDPALIGKRRTTDRLDLGLTLNKAALRELNEELGWSQYDTTPLDWQALIVMNDTPVSEVHVGVVAVLDTTRDIAFKPADAECCELVWRTPNEILSLDPARVEGWTAMVALNAQSLA